MERLVDAYPVIGQVEEDRRLYSHTFVRSTRGTTSEKSTAGTLVEFCFLTSISSDLRPMPATMLDRTNSSADNSWESHIIPVSWKEIASSWGRCDVFDWLVTGKQTVREAGEEVLSPAQLLQGFELCTELLVCSTLISI